MKASEHWHTASDGKKLFFRRFLPEGPPKAVLHLAHGVSEHSARYAPLAEALTAAGYAMYAGDHRGHGKTASGPDELGVFEGGVARVLEDLVELTRDEKREHPGLPLILMGHSMGSFLVQSLMGTHGDEFQAVVLSGTGGKPPPLAYVGQYIGRLERLRLGPTGKSRVIRALTFDDFNRQFPAPRPTPYEWLSRARSEVDKYAADPGCGFEPSISLWVDVLDLIIAVAQPAHQAKVPRALPVYVFGGSEDPVSERAHGVLQLVRALKATGLTDVSMRLYAGGRHEMLNETNRDEVHRELLAWLDARV
jgi:alpha-beta hydrolase superfamily lysophospholipase